MTPKKAAAQRVLMTAETIGDVFAYALDLSRALGERGVEVALATSGAPLSTLQRETAERIPHLRVFESAFKVEWMDDSWRDVERAGDWLLGLASRIGPDLVHLNGFAHGALPWGAPTLVAAHSCLLSRWAAVEREPLPEALHPYRNAVAAGLAAADLVAAPSAALLAALDEQYGPPPSGQQRRVIAHGCGSRLFQAGPKDPILLAPARTWEGERNLALLDRVAEHLPWPLYLAGESSPLHPSEAVAPAPRHLHLLGKQTPRVLAAWLGRSSIFVLPTRYEPFGLAAVEAALAGCALVLGDIPSLREVWGDAAVFVAPDDPAALEAALAALIADPERRSELGALAKERARGYTVERMADGYLAAYAALLDSARVAAPRRIATAAAPPLAVAV